MGFVQNDFKSGTAINKNTLEEFTFKNDLFFDQANFELKKPDHESINDTIRRAYLHYDFSSGIFIPTYKAKLIGVKPSFGFSVGVIYERTTYDITLDFRFGHTKNEYQLANYDKTDNYFGGYIGFDILRDIWTNNKNQILLLGGFGMDIFEIVPAEYDDPTFLESLLFGAESIITKNSKNIKSLNINIGLMYRFYFKRNNYLGIRYRYNKVDYNSKKILTDVSGNFHSITLSYGGFTKDY